MVSRTFPATDESFVEANAWVEEELEKAGASMKSMMQVTVCFEEIFVNVAHYAYGEGEGNVELVLDCIDGVFSITFIDSGVFFDPLAKEDPDITVAAEERKIGGLGILMVKKSMDDVSYEYKDNKNIFTMKKNIL